jgi:hypothetical protein
VGTSIFAFSQEKPILLFVQLHNLASDWWCLVVTVIHSWTWILLIEVEANDLGLLGIFTTRSAMAVNKQYFD